MTETDLNSFFGHITKPGAVWLTNGEKGGGKTHTAMAVAEQFVKGMYPSVGKIVVCTNIICLHKVHGRVIEETPADVHHITTMLEVFPIVVDSIEKYGREVTIMLILDEAQDFIGGDSNATNESIMMKKFLGTIRKYNLMVWFLTPTANSIGPAFRNLMNDPKYPGNVTCLWMKDMDLNARYIKAFDLKCTPRELMAVKPYDADPAFIRVPVTEWTGVYTDLKEGQYCYDHTAPATFYQGDGFDWDTFNRIMGGVSSLRALETIKEYYAQIDKKERNVKDPVQVEREKKLAMCIRAHDELGHSWEDAAKVVGISVSTLKNWRKEAGMPDDIDTEKQEKTSKATPKTSCPSKFAPRSMDRQTTGGVRKSEIYISNKGAPIEGGCEKSMSVGSGESVMTENVQNPYGKLPIPNGKYSMKELSRTVDYCIGGDDHEG